jgi:hypothetical protein
MHFYLSALNFFEPLFYVSLFVIFLQLLLVAAISVVVSVITRSEVMSILTSFLLILGIDYTMGINSYFSSQGRFTYIFGYFEQTIHHTNMAIQAPVTLEQLAFSIALPLVIAVIALPLTFPFLHGDGG